MKNKINKNVLVFVCIILFVSLVFVCVQNFGLKNEIDDLKETLCRMSDF